MNNRLNFAAFENTRKNPDTRVYFIESHSKNEVGFVEAKI